MKMRYLTGLLVILNFHQTILAQQSDMTTKISDLFFGLQLDAQPDSIANESGIDFELGVTEYPLNTTYYYDWVFNQHPTIIRELRSGKLTITHSEGQWASEAYELTMIFQFKNEYDQTDTYNELVNEFEPYSSKTLIETQTTKKHDTVSQVVVYQKDKNSKYPRLSFYFDQSEKNDLPLIVTYESIWKK